MTTPPFPMTRTRTCLQPSSKLGLLSWAIALGLNAPSLMAEGSGQTFNIPAQPLGSALNAYADAANVQLSYPAVLADGIKSPGVSGQHTPEQALRKLLGGSLIIARTTANGTVTLEKVAQSVPATAPSSQLTTLSTVKVSGKAEYGSADPYRKDYAVPNSTTATKTDTPIMETPVSIQVVPRAVLDDQQAISVGDALKNVSGVQPGAYSFYDNFMLRGFEAGQSTYRNGLRQFAITNLETANLERIEVLKGPAAILFGRVNPGGLINLATKRPLDTPYYSVQQQFGSYDLYRTTVDATGPVLADNSLLYRMNVAYKDNNTFRDFIHQEHVFVAPSLAWRPTDRFESNLDIEFQRDEFVEDGSDNGIPAIGNRPANIPINRYFGDAIFNRQHPNTQEKVIVAFDWSYQLNSAWQLKNRFQYLDTQYQQTIFWSDGLAADNRTIGRGLWNTPIHRTAYLTNLDLTGKFTTGIADHDVLLGFDLNHTDENSGSGFSGYDASITSIDLYHPVYGMDLVSLNGVNNFYYKYQESWYGVYFQDQITLWDKLHILGGGRHDWAEVGSDDSATSFSDINISRTRSEFFSPRVGLLYQPWQWLSVYGNYVESFGSNNAGRSFGGQAFTPETASQYEAGIKTEFFDGGLSSTLAYYDLTKQNVLTTDPNHPLFSIAVGEARSQGLEFDVTGKVTENLKLIGAYAYTDAQITKDNNGNEGKQLTAVPRNSGSLWARYDLHDGLLRGLNFGTGVYLREQRQGDNANSFQLPGYVRWDAGVGYSFKQGKIKITPQLNVYNLLDKTYYDHSSYRGNIRPGEPLTFLGSVRVEF